MPNSPHRKRPDLSPHPRSKSVPHSQYEPLEQHASINLCEKRPLLALALEADRVQPSRAPHRKQRTSHYAKQRVDDLSELGLKGVRLGGPDSSALLSASINSSISSTRKRGFRVAEASVRRSPTPSLPYRSSPASFSQPVLQYRCCSQKPHSFARRTPPAFPHARERTGTAPRHSFRQGTVDWYRRNALLRQRVGAVETPRVLSSNA